MPGGPVAPSAQMPSPAAVVPGPAAPATAGAATQACPNCGSQTPSGFTFCQHCGSKLPPAPVGHTGPPPISGTTGAPAEVEIAPTLAASGPPPADFMGGSAPTPGAYGAPAWGVLVNVNRDGTDGVRHELSGEHVHVGRTGSEVRFDDDRYLADRHARLEQAGRQIVPMEQRNGVFRRLSAPIDLTNGDVLLVGREVMRFELVSDEERRASPLVVHGVALFGSPPREPWGRLRQLLANGGEREVRYLVDDEYTIGREDGDWVFRDDAFLSRVHGAFRRRGTQYQYEDLQSSNGSFLRLCGPTPLAAGDHLRMGDQLFRFEISP